MSSELANYQKTTRFLAEVNKTEFFGYWSPLLINQLCSQRRVVGRDSKQPPCSHCWDFCNLTATGKLFHRWAETKHALRRLTTPAPSSERLLPAPRCNYLCIVFSSILPVSGKSGVGPNLLALEFRASSSSVDLQEEGCRDGRKLSQYSYISHRDGFDLPDHYDYWLVGSKITEKEKKQD